MTHCSVCGEDAMCDVQWGGEGLPVQVASLCGYHLDGLWLQINPLLKLNRAWFRVGKPGTIEEEKP